MSYHLTEDEKAMILEAPSLFPVIEEIIDAHRLSAVVEDDLAHADQVVVKVVDCLPGSVILEAQFGAPIALLPGEFLTIPTSVTVTDA